jgi:hypothetical protein
MYKHHKKSANVISMSFVFDDFFGAQDKFETKVR